MRASLGKNLLAAMLSRGGWLSSVEVDLTRTKRPLPGGFSPYLHSEEWICSRHLARQCALASRWAGNGADSDQLLVKTLKLTSLHEIIGWV
jgi:hypothetical protein